MDNSTQESNQQKANKYRFYVQSAAWLATSIAFTLTLLKAWTWWQTDSVGVLASLMDSLLDLVASLINLFAIRYALMPADNNHRFGHGKAESLAALGQGLLITSSALFLLYSAIEKFINPTPLHSPEYGIYVSIFATLLVVLLLSYQRKVIRLTDSVAIKADSLHYKTDLYLNIGIVIALYLSWKGLHWADPLFALGLGFYILYSAFELIKEALNSLLDRQLPDDEVNHIKTLALNISGVRGIHDLRTRKSGMTRFIQLHIELDDHLNLIEAHDIADEVENIVRQELIHSEIIVHVDPCSVVHKGQDEIRFYEEDAKL